MPRPRRPWPDITELESPSDLFKRDLKRPHGRWIFRGQKSAQWPLVSSLERALATFDYASSQAKNVENQLVREFQRRFPLYGTPPAQYDTLQWLALMQHHGAPTRLLDWSYSIAVAAFFAIETATEDAVIWAIDANFCRDASNRIILRTQADGRDLLVQKGDEESARAFDLHMRKSDARTHSMVYPVNPFQLNERLTIQQGIFLCPGDVRRTFHDNLDVLRDKPNSAGKFYKLIVPKAMHRDILTLLHRMNLTSATLFPGLDGFARSLKSRLVFRDLFDRRQ